MIIPRLIQARCSALGDNAILPTQVLGREYVSALFTYEVDCIIHQENLNVRDLLGLPLSLVLHHSQAVPHYLHGLIMDVIQQSKKSHYHLTLSPWFFLLNHSQDSRIFQEQSIPDMVISIFKEKGFHDFCLDGLTCTYETLPYVVQLNESDFNFISRLLEQAGIYYYFSHTENQHILHLVDQNLKTPCISGVILDLNDQQSLPHITHWQVFQHFTTQQLIQMDYNPDMPNDRLQSQASLDIGSSHPALENITQYQFPGGYQDVQAGQRQSEIKMQALASKAKKIEGKSDCDYFRAGSRIQLQSDESGKSYLITKLEFCVIDESVLANKSQPKREYKNTFICQFASNYRPPQLTPIPEVPGLQTATVVGPADQSLYLDQQGRVKIQFHWDRYGKHNEHSSCWLRVMQLFAGSNGGTFFIPRIGQEVWVAFANGDPNRPLIMGAAYNGENEVPYNLTKSCYVSGIKTQSTEGKEGNELTFDDTPGAQLFLLKTQGDYTQVVRRDARSIIDGNLISMIKNGDFVLEILQGSAKTQAAKSITLQVKNSTLQITPNGIILNAPKIEMNPNSSEANVPSSSHWIEDALDVENFLE